MQRVDLPPMESPEGLDTVLVARSRFESFPYRLSWVHATLSNRPVVGGNAALADARGVATIVRELLATGRLGWQGPPLVAAPYAPIRIPVCPRVAKIKGIPQRLPRIVEGLPDDRTLPDADPLLAGAYMEKLLAALADRVISPSEFAELSGAACRAGFNQHSLRATHHQLLEQTQAQAEEDGVITRTEAADLWAATRELEQPEQVSHLITETPMSSALQDQRIVISGDRDEADDLAEWVGFHSAAWG